MTNPSPIDELCRGVVDLHTRADLEQRLASGKKLRVKAGFDPTRPDLHLGHTVLMQKMRAFQELGHEVVFLIGDFTAMVGDPTGRNELRPRLTRDDVRAAAETYTEQAFKILDRDRTVVRYNSEWLDALTPSDMIELCAKYTVARMLERDDFSKRFAEQRPIFVHEFMYPLLQAYDSVALENDVELGGTDQLFNLLVGRDLMPRYGKQAQIVITTPILEGTDARIEHGKVVGAKMSKSANNYVAVNDAPFDMLQKLMLVDDQVIWRYLDLLSSKSLEEIKAEKADVQAGRTNILVVKERFAVEIITRFHDAEAATEAVARRHAISAGAVPDDVEELEVQAEVGAITLPKALQLAGLVKSTSEGMRMIQQGAVHVDHQKASPTDVDRRLAVGERVLVRIGSKNRRFAWLRIVP